MHSIFLRIRKNQGLSHPHAAHPYQSYLLLTPQKKSVGKEKQNRLKLPFPAKSSRKKGGRPETGGALMQGTRVSRRVKRDLLEPGLCEEVLVIGRRGSKTHLLNFR